MAISFSAGNVLEHVELNNMILALKGWGVLADPDSTSLLVGEKAVPAMGVTVDDGHCFINSVEYEETTTNDLTIEAAHATLCRKDLITYDPTTSHPVVTKGTDHAGGDSDPIYPPDIPDGDILLAIVAVDAAVTTITDADITDCRIFLPEYNNNIYSVQSSTTIQDSETVYYDTITQTYWVVAKEYTVPEGIVGGSLRVDCTVFNYTSAQMWFKVNRNGIAASAETYTTETTETTLTLEPFGGWTGGDTIQIMVKVNSGTGYYMGSAIKCDIIETKLQRDAVTW